MKVILLQDVEGLGKKYEIKEVKSGHARNLLLPQKMGRPATKEALKWLADQKEVIEKTVEEDLKKSQSLASQLDGLELNIAVKVGEEGQLFEGVGVQKIVEKLKEMGFDVKKSQVKLEHPIKDLGDFPVSISLEHNLEAEIKVTVSAFSEKNSKEDVE
ncbi:MAG: 50S ribosomal protein L9 [Candidatus Staskawiczbacteria bacterium]|jgi:large subunit ribosomal protein L9